MKLDFCADDICFDSFDPETQVIKVRKEEYFLPFLEAAKREGYHAIHVEELVNNKLSESEMNIESLF